MTNPTEVEKLVERLRTQRDLTARSLAAYVIEAQAAEIARLRDAIVKRYEVYQHNAKRHDPLAEDTCTRWDCVQHTLEALEILGIEAGVALPNVATDGSAEAQSNAALAATEGEP